MIDKIINEISKFYNGKKVVFDPMREMTEKTRSFKLEEHIFNSKKYVLYARINELEDRVEVINLSVIGPV